MRLNDDSTLDQNFGNGGYAVVQYNGDAIASQILLQPDGKIIVIGKYNHYSDFSFTAVRFHEDGSLDTSYGQNGKITVPQFRLTSADDVYFKGNLQPDGKLAVAGNRYDTASDDFMAMRFTATGQIDSTFGTNGLVEIDFYNLGLHDYGQQILIGQNGTVLIGGQAFNSNNFSRFGIVAVTASGQIDLTFGTDGRGQMLGGYKMRAMEFDAAGRIVVAGQAVQTGQYWVGRFIYGSPTGIGDHSDQYTSDFLLEQNYPNPFNPSTTISFRLSTFSEVRLEIYNLLGQKVRTLVNESKAAGVHTVKWDGANDTGQPAASGVYLYRLVVGEASSPSHVQTRKMLLLQ
jgi:uncharacterized delta-60 repeat protein